jgi:hypothetical protein
MFHIPFFEDSGVFTCGHAACGVFAAFACTFDTDVKAPFPAQTGGTANALAVIRNCLPTTVTPEFSFCDETTR